MEGTAAVSFRKLQARLWTAAMLLVLFLAPHAAALAVADSGCGAACCRSKKTCCCRKSGTGKAGGVGVTARTCGGRCGEWSRALDPVLGLGTSVLGVLAGIVMTGFAGPGTGWAPVVLLVMFALFQRPPPRVVWNRG